MIMIISARYYLLGTEVNDSNFFKNQIRLFQNAMVAQNCFYVEAIQCAKTGQRRERGRRVVTTQRRTPFHRHLTISL